MAKKNKRIIPTSVVITVKNEKYSIKTLLNSLESQSVTPEEIIFVDGGSTDRTAEIIKERMKENRKIKLIIRKGASRAEGRNIGILNSSSDIIAVTDAGGYPKKNWLEKITAPFISPKVKVVSGYYQAQALTVFEKCVVPYFLIMPDRIISGMEFLPSSRSVAFRKLIWKKVGGYPQKFSHNEDLVFDYNLKKVGVSFFFEPEAQVVWFPPKNPFQAAKKLFRFAQGDAQGDILRPKIKFIFLRYGVGLLLFGFGLYQIFIFSVILYFLWAIWKNFRYARFSQALFWLPVIQITSDFAVMAGTVLGKLTRK